MVVTNGRLSGKIAIATSGATAVQPERELEPPRSLDGRAG